QAPAAKGAAAAPAPATDNPPPGRYVPRDGLVLYAESDGLNAHGEAWKKSAAYKMLNETPLGAMLEDLGTQFLDKLLAKLPNRKMNGADAVGLVKHVAQHGYALGITVNKGAHPVQGVLVLP